MWAWGEGAREELAWEDRRGGGQARQSMKQLTGAGKGGQGEEKGEQRIWNTGGCHCCHTPGG